MQVGIKTISWGERVEDVGLMLRQIKDAGYTGVEFAQHPDELGPVEQLYSTLSTLGLQCIGIAGGSLQEKIDFVRKYTTAEQVALIQALAAKSGGSKKIRSQALRLVQPYIYLDGWEDGLCLMALGNRMILALHPNMFKQVQTFTEAEEYLVKYPGLQFLPDTALLTIAGEDLVKVIDRYLARIEAVHLKDWNGGYGRAYQFYSRGFVELGEGDIPLEDVIELLRRRNYKKWVVVEQDATIDPYQSACKSREWLQRRGI